jgi:hypothetical protein
VPRPLDHRRPSSFATQPAISAHVVVMSNPIAYASVSSPGEVRQILDLQAANLASALTPATIGTSSSG